MNAVERALRHIERLIASRASPRPSPQRKPAKRKAAPKKKVARVVSNRRRHTSAKREYNPPVTHPDVAELEQTFAPAPTPPEVEGPITPVFPVINESFTRAGDEHGAYPVTLARPAWADAFERAGPAPEPVVVASLGSFRGSCKAIDADTGRQCRKLEHADPVHRHERGEFTRVLQPGGVPLLHERLDSYSTRRDTPELVDTYSNTQAKRFERRVGRPRKSAHAGDATTTGLASIDAGGAS